MDYVFNLVALSSGNPSLENKNNNLWPYILLAHKGTIWISLISVIFEEYLATKPMKLRFSEFLGIHMYQDDTYRFEGPKTHSS